MSHPYLKYKKEKEYRQPPAPPSLMGGVTDPDWNKDEGKSENTIRTRPYYFRSCKKRLITNIDSLPDDLVFKILVNLPAQDIYKGAMLVRRNWYRMVHTLTFTYTHLQHSPKGLLFVYMNMYGTSVAIRQGRIEVYEFPRIKSRFWSSFNGLFLKQHVVQKHLFITNPITKQDFSLPPHPAAKIFDSTLGYLPSTMEYKVVIWHSVANTDDNIIKCSILTVGVDNSWRDVCTQHISSTDPSPFFRLANLTLGFMHWCGNTDTNTHVWTLNLETEILSQTPLPPEVVGNNSNVHLKYPNHSGVKSKYYLSTPGKSLSMLVWLSRLCWDMWDMASETGEWTKIGRIDLEDEWRRLKELRGGGYAVVMIPVGWLEYREVLVLSFASYRTKLRITYNLRTQEIGSFDLHNECVSPTVHVYTNSLEWLAPSI